MYYGVCVCVFVRACAWCVCVCVCVFLYALPTETFCDGMSLGCIEACSLFPTPAPILFLLKTSILGSGFDEEDSFICATGSQTAEIP